MGMSDDNLKHAPAFAEAAVNYCRLIDELCVGRIAGQYRQLEAALAGLYSAILPLHVERVDKRLEAIEERDRGEISRALIGTLAEDIQQIEQWHRGNEYKLEAVAEHEMNRASMIFDDLADIYRDLRVGLWHWQQRTPLSQANAVWEWRWHFEHHWGDHLFRAMATVHEFRYGLIKD